MTLWTIPVFKNSVNQSKEWGEIVSVCAEANRALFWLVLQYRWHAGSEKGRQTALRTHCLFWHKGSHVILETTPGHQISKLFKTDRKRTENWKKFCEKNKSLPREQFLFRWKKSDAPSINKCPIDYYCRAKQNALRLDMPKYSIGNGKEKNTVLIT